MIRGPQLGIANVVVSGADLKPIRETSRFVGCWTATFNLNVSIRFLSRHHPASFHVGNACSDRSVHLFRVECISHSAEDAGVYNNKHLV